MYWVNRLVVITVSIALSLAMLVPTAASAAPLEIVTRPVSSTDIDEHCRADGYDGAALDAGNAYGWRCVRGTDVRHGMDLDRLCARQAQGAIARLTDFHNPQGWECWLTPTEVATSISAADFSGFCRRFGYNGAVLVSPDAYGWFCDSPNRRDGLSVTQLCRLQFGLPTAVDRIVNFYDPYSWTCRVPVGAAPQPQPPAPEQRPEQPAPGTQNPRFFCITGPGEPSWYCPRPAQETSTAPTWRSYLAWLRDLAEAGGQAESAVSCGTDLASGRPLGIAACFDLLGEQHPVASAALNALTCGVDPTLRSCLAVGIDGLKVVLAAIDFAARTNADFDRFLDQEIPALT